jgi:hypothetical protein
MTLILSVQYDLGKRFEAIAQAPFPTVMVFD